jgi:predicted MPP superfamily phosphohydrolase
VGVLLRRLRAPLGVFLVRGNWEHWNPDPGELKVYESAGVTFLNNDARRLDGNAWVVGIDDSLAGTPDPRRALAELPAGAFKIALFHSPAYFDSVEQRIDLGLAGHTHGGQLRIPFLPPLWLQEGSGTYVEGWYERGQGRMYVSRGIGNSILEMRLACRPEIAVFQLEPPKR